MLKFFCNQLRGPFEFWRKQHADYAWCIQVTETTETADTAYICNKSKLKSS